MHSIPLFPLFMTVLVWSCGYNMLVCVHKIKMWLWRCEKHIRHKMYQCIQVRERFWHRHGFGCVEESLVLHDCVWMRQNVCVFTVQTLPLCLLRVVGSLPGIHSSCMTTHRHSHTHIVDLFEYGWREISQQANPSRVTTYWFHAHRLGRVLHAGR